MARSRMSVGTAWAVLALVAVLAGAPSAQANAVGPAGSITSGRAASARSAPLPTLSGVEFRELYNRYEPLPRTTPLTTAPAITGNAAADRRIRSMAEARGYRLRAQHIGPLGTALGVPVDPGAAAQLDALARRAAASGYRLSATFGYRSVDLQRTLFTRRIAGFSSAQIAAGVADRSIDTALRSVAPPGYSKHQSGMALDLKAAGGSGGTFASSGVGRWMAANNYANAKEFGFIPSYPPGGGLQGPEPEPWEYVYVGRKAIECAVPLVRRGDRPEFESCMGTSPIARKYASLGGSKGLLGPVVAPERQITDKRGRFARYQKGNIYWSPTTGANEVHGSVLGYFEKQGSVRGSLGYPVSDLVPVGSQGLREQRFERGVLRLTPTGRVYLANP